eukprot:2962757-Rhodomonas_salina.1
MFIAGSSLSHSSSRRNPSAAAADAPAASSLLPRLSGFAWLGPPSWSRGCCRRLRPAAFRRQGPFRQPPGAPRLAAAALGCRARAPPDVERRCHHVHVRRGPGRGHEGQQERPPPAALRRHRSDLFAPLC